MSFEFATESEIIALFQSLSPDLPDGATGIGDDCAVLPWTQDRSRLFSTDLLIEDVHFLRKQISPRQLGHKSLAVNLSDIAAMGGAARAAFLSVAFPQNVTGAFIREFAQGWAALARRFGVALLGGDTNRSQGPIVVNVLVMGDMATSEIKWRSSARPGDRIVVSGPLGDSRAGLGLLLQHASLVSEAETELVRRHHEPWPELEVGRALALHPGVHALMDLSDGLAKDMSRLLAASGCSGQVELEKIPLSPELQEVCQVRGWDALEMAAAGGEDYKLLGTVAPEAFDEVARRVLEATGVTLADIGEVTAGAEPPQFRRQGRPVTLALKSFEHFE